MLANDSKTVWGLIQQNRFEESIELADELFENEGNIFEQRNKLIALIHLKRYDKAIDLSAYIINFREGENATDYIVRGLAYFFTGNRDAAIKDWLSARFCKYQDASGGISVFSILYFACVITADSGLRKVVMAGIKKRLKDRYVRNWPGPIGNYIIKGIDEDQLLSYVSTVPILKERHLCQAHFACAVRNLDEGNIELYKFYLSKAVENAPWSYLEDEFYLAMYELSKFV